MPLNIVMSYVFHSPNRQYLEESLAHTWCLKTICLMNESTNCAVVTGGWEGVMKEKRKELYITDMTLLLSAWMVTMKNYTTLATVESWLGNFLNRMLHIQGNQRTKFTEFSFLVHSSVISNGTHKDIFIVYQQQGNYQLLRQHCSWVILVPLKLLCAHEPPGELKKI